jgi:hypothetical protein
MSPVLALRLRRSALHLCVLAALSLGPGVAFAASHAVTSCADDGSPDTLRSVVENPATVDYDTVDLTQLPTGCSTITLTQHQAIHVAQNSLYITGPGAGALTIDADAGSAAFNHTGTGTLYVSDVTVANGYAIGPASVGGGCIASSSSLFVLDSVVTGCRLKSTSSDSNDDARGGGLYAGANLTLVRSKVTDNHVFTSDAAPPEAGGAFVGGVAAIVDSTISGNSALGLFVESDVGGLWINGVASIERSTISGNSAYDFAGAWLASGGGVDASTISGNSASYYAGLGTGAAPLTISNSTIAFNHASMPTDGNGLWTGSTAATIKNSIVADNTGPVGSSDLYASSVSGIHGNIVVSSSGPLPADNTIGVCPKLDLLAQTGGLTATHGLLDGSPAIDQGDSADALDQRGQPRPAGAADDIGAFERQPADRPERILTSGFDGFCDQ